MSGQPAKRHTVSGQFPGTSANIRSSDCATLAHREKLEKEQDEFEEEPDLRIPVKIAPHSV